MHEHACHLNVMGVRQPTHVERSIRRIRQIAALPFWLCPNGDLD
jgi:hypothetical protein